MPWNQSGGGSNNNPWGKRPQRDNQSADEAFKNFQRKLDSILRGGKSGGGGAEGGDGDGATAAGPSAGIILLGLLALWLVFGFYMVDAREQAVVQRFGQYKFVTEPGLHWRIPFPVDTVTKVRSKEVKSVAYSAKVLTADLNLVEMQFGVQYQLRDPKKFLFSIRDAEETLREVSESAIREVVGRSDLEAVFVSNRQQITASTMVLIQSTLDAYNAGISVTSVNLTDIQVPDAVAPSQRDANKALADKDRLIKEAEAYSSGILPVAEGQAQRQILEAQAYKSQVVAIAEGEGARFEQFAGAYSAAPQVTRQRLYIETIEAVLGKSQKIILDTKAGGGGNMIYLPLDRLMERRGSVTVQQMPAAGATEQDSSTGSDARPRGER
jgi:membrane protease subunit HflK